MPKYNLNRIFKSLQSLELGNYMKFIEAYNSGVFTMEQVSEFASSTTDLLGKHRLLSEHGDTPRRLQVMFETIPALDIDDFI